MLQNQNSDCLNKKNISKKRYWETKTEVQKNGIMSKKIIVLRRFCKIYDNDLLNKYGKYIVPDESEKRIYFGQKSSFHGIKS